MKEISVILNARIQSSRCPNKLLRPFADSSLIDICVEKMSRMDFVQHRFLAARECLLRQRAAPYSNIAIMHRERKAVDRGTHHPQVSFAHYLNSPTEWILILNPCLPLLSVDTLREACDYFQRTSYKSYTSAVPCRDWVFDNAGKALTYTDPRHVATNVAVTHFRAAHAFHIVNREYFRKTRGRYWTLKIGDPDLIAIPEEEAVDVDTEQDFIAAEAIYKQALKGEST